MECRRTAQAFKARKLDGRTGRLRLSCQRGMCSVGPLRGHSCFKWPPGSHWSTYARTSLVPTFAVGFMKLPFDCCMMTREYPSIGATAVSSTTR